MKKVCQVAVVMTAALFCARAHASCSTPITTGMNASQIQAAVNSCSSGSTASFPAGTYSISGTISIPCGVTVTGPSVPLATFTGPDGYIREGYAPTAILNWTGGAPGVMFSYPSCSTAATFALIECNMNTPSPQGGQCLYVNYPTSNYTVTEFYFHGNQAASGGGGNSPSNTLLWFDGNSSAAMSSGNSVTWGRAGASGDCSNIMSDNTDYGGGCSGIGFHTPETNLTVNNNYTTDDENGLKFYEGTGNGMYRCLNCTVEYNDWSRFHRLGFETQVNAPSSSSNPTVSMLIRYNSAHDPFHVYQGTFGISSANGCDNTNPSPGGCVTNTDYNLIIDNSATTGKYNGDGLEQWGSAGSTANYNLIQGEWANSIIINKDGAMSDNYNLIQSDYGAGGPNTPADCYPAFFGPYGWWGQSNSPANTPTGTGNTCNFFNGSVQTSVAPTISPGSSSFTTGVTVTLTNPGTNRDANTGIWCTTDGSTPVPGTGTSAYYSSGSTLTFSVTTTLNCVGMWGAANQPTAYAVGPLGGGICGSACPYGYQPSAVVSATYTAGSAPTLNSVSLSAAGGATSLYVGATLQMTATCHYSDGSTTTCNQADSHGNQVTAWNSSNGNVTINSSGLATGVATGTASVTATVTGGVVSPGYGLTVNPAPVTLTRVSLAGAGGAYTLNVGATLQMTATCHYSDGSSTTCNQADSHGNQVTAWNSSNGNVSINSSGLATGVATGTASVTATVTGGVVSPGFGLTVNNTPVTLTSVSLAGAGGASTLYVGATLQITATCHYSDGSSTTCNQADSHGNQVTAWNSSNGNVTITSSGLATGVTTGTASVTATVTGGVVSPGYGLTVNPAPVTLSSVSLTAAGGATSLYVGATLQMTATCNYSDGSTTTCNQADSHGNQVTAWNSSNGNVSINSSGLATGAAAGTASVTATVTGGVVSPGFGLTVNPAPVTLSSVSLAGAGGAYTLYVGATLQMTATCNYSDGSTTTCNQADSHGNQVTAWNSSNGNVSINSSGLATGVATGTASVTATVTGGVVSPGFGLTVNPAPVTLSSVSLATTGGVSSLVAGTTNQLIGTCHYSDGSSTSCRSAADSHGNIVTTWASSVPAVGTVNSSGLVTGVAAGGTNVTASTVPGPSAIGANTFTTSSSSTTGTISYDYGVTGTSASSYTVGSCNIYLPSGTYTAGGFYDCIVTPAPSPTTQAANALCSGRYTIPSSFAGGVWVSIPMSSCPSLAANSAYWVGQATNQSPSGPRGYTLCGSNCNGPVPSEGSGTYGYYYLAGNPFGQYTGMATTLTAGGGSQDSIYLNLSTNAVVSPALALTVTEPTLASAYLTAPGSTVSVGGTLQMAAHCVYTNPAVTTDCTVTDIYGNAVTSWASSDITRATVGQVGQANPGLVTAVAPGTVAITAVIDSELSSSNYSVTVPTPPVTLSGLSLATTGGVTGLFVGGTNQLVATCHYSDGSTTNCTATDSHGNVAGGYASSAPAFATVNATSGLTTGVAPGSTILTARAGGYTSPGLPLTVITAPNGVYYISISGPVKFTGTVHF